MKCHFARYLLTGVCSIILLFLVFSISGISNPLSSAGKLSAAQQQNTVCPALVQNDCECLRELETVPLSQDALNVAIRHYNHFLQGQEDARNGQEYISVDFITRPAGEPEKHYYSKYAFLDSDRDGIPELHIKSARYYFIIKYENSGLTVWKELSRNYEPLDNKAFLAKNTFSVPQYEKYHYMILGTDAAVLWELSFGIYDADGNGIYDEKDDYQFDGTKVSKKQWDFLTKRYLTVGTDEIQWNIMYEESGTNSSDMQEISATAETQQGQSSGRDTEKDTISGGAAGSENLAQQNIEKMRYFFDMSGLDFMEYSGVPSLFDEMLVEEIGTAIQNQCLTEYLSSNQLFCKELDREQKEQALEREQMSKNGYLHAYQHYADNALDDVWMEVPAQGGNKTDMLIMNCAGDGRKEYYYFLADDSASGFIRVKRFYIYQNDEEPPYFMDWNGNSYMAVPYSSEENGSIDAVILLALTNQDALNGDADMAGIWQNKDYSTGVCYQYCITTQDQRYIQNNMPILSDEDAVRSHN